MTCLIMDETSGSAVWLPPFRITFNVTLRFYFTPQRSWGSPYRVFSSPQVKLPLRTVLSSHCVSFQYRDLCRLRQGLYRITAFRVFFLRKVLAFSTGFYSERKADPLLGFCPSRVCPVSEMKRFSPFLLP